MTTERTTINTSGGEGPGSGLTRLRMADAIHPSRQAAGEEAGQRFVIIQRSGFTPLPRPRGPRRLAAGPTG
jgi:hypothetical protein